MTDIQQIFSLPARRLGPALVGCAESQWFDRKSSRISPRDLADSAIGFANAEGGVIVIGLWRGEVQGIDEQPQPVHNAWRQATIDFSEPPVRVRHRLLPCTNRRGEADHLLALEIEASSRVHANRRDEVFLRVGDENRKLTFSQRQELLYEKGLASFEGSSVAGATLDDCDADLLEHYAASVGHPNPARLLRSRGLLTAEDQLAVAGALLFCRHPQALYPEAYVRLLRYRGSERGTGSRQQLLEDVRCEGPIPTSLDQARIAIADLVPSRRALGAEGKFQPIPIIPTDAWLEGLVNAVIHRSYSAMGDHIRVEIFDDRIEIVSPGRFPGLADLADPLSIPRYARNPRIARACAELHLGQELGEGIRRMFEEMSLAALVEPLYTQTSGSVRLTLSAAPRDSSTDIPLPRGGAPLMRLLRQAGQAGTGELVQELGLSRPTVLRILRTLEAAGLIEWVGQSRRDPRAFWRVVTPPRPESDR